MGAIVTMTESTRCASLGDKSALMILAPPSIIMLLMPFEWSCASIDDHEISPASSDILIYSPPALCKIAALSLEGSLLVTINGALPRPLFASCMTFVCSLKAQRQ